MGKEGFTEGPRVSVVLPTYNRGELLGRAVESVRNQSYDNVELIIVDDHSRIPAERVLSERSLDGPEQVRCLRHDENRGANAARNTGIEASTGEYLAFLDDDDLWKPTFIESQVEAFRRAGPDVGVVYVASENVDKEGNLIGVSRPDARDDVTKDLICGATIGSFSRIMVERSTVKRVGLLDERFPSWQDWDWYLRLSEHCSFRAIDEPLVRRLVSSHEQISDDYEGKRDVSYPLLLEKHRSLAARYGPLYERRFAATLTRSVGFSGLRNGYHLEPLQYLLRSLAHYPFSPKTYLYLSLAIGGQPTFRFAQSVKRRFSHVVDNI